MPSDPKDQSCRLCHAPLKAADRRSLCTVCDEYAQHVAIHSDKKFDRLLGELQNGALFLAATRNAH